MKKSDDGGPVYPGYEITSGDGKGGWTKVNEHPGITRRNECADKIAAGMMANHKTCDDFAEVANKDGKFVADLVAELAYLITDALIARGKKE